MFLFTFYEYTYISSFVTIKFRDLSKRNNEILIKIMLLEKIVFVLFQLSLTMIKVGEKKWYPLNLFGGTFLMNLQNIKHSLFFTNFATKKLPQISLVKYIFSVCDFLLFLGKLVIVLISGTLSYFVFGRYIPDIQVIIFFSSYFICI